MPIQHSSYFIAALFESPPHSSAVIDSPRRLQIASAPLTRSIFIDASRFTPMQLIFAFFCRLG
jgi:hypothetical protein